MQVNSIFTGRGTASDDPYLAATSPLGIDGEEYARRFWLHYLHVGILVFIGEAVSTLVYFVLTPHGPHRVLLVALTSTVILALILSFPLARRFAASGWRSHYSFGWTLAAGIIVAASIHLDRGADSPILFLMVLPIVSAALALNVRQVIVCGIATLGEFTFICLDDPVVHRSTSEMSMFAMLLLGLVVIAVGVSAARVRLLDDEMSLRTNLTSMATIDALTGCLNHGAFYDRLEVEINRALRQHESLSLLMIDIDYFKAFNDTYGHLAGDDALESVGSTLVKLSRSFDVVGRIGGDEFAVVLPASSLAAASEIALRMSTALTSPARPTVSIGYASLDSSEPNAKRLVHDADRSLYEVKLNGRGRSAPLVSSSSSKSETRSVPVESDADLKLVEEQVRAADRAAAEALSILDAYQSTSIVGLGFVDRDFRIVRINPMLAAIHGGSVSDQLGRTVEEVVPVIWPQLEPLYRFVVDTNSPVANREVVGETSSDPGVMRTWLTNLYPVNIENEVIGVGIVVIDITDWKRPKEGKNSRHRTRANLLEQY
jgi:diguanylate cyclase (GGDEF)-like protein